jgi:hypothetical protein
MMVKVIRAGSFGGTYFRPIHSSVTGRSYTDEAWKELPQEWLKGLNIKKVVASPTYDINVNKYHEKCGQDLEAWESSGWITEVDPYGWFQWYCRFYQGRRCSDDARQIGRGMGVMVRGCLTVCVYDYVCVCVGVCDGVHLFLVVPLIGCCAASHTCLTIFLSCCIYVMLRYTMQCHVMPLQGPKGRWRNNLGNKCAASGRAPAEAANDFSISPKIRQLLQVTHLLSCPVLSCPVLSCPVLPCPVLSMSATGHMDMILCHVTSKGYLICLIQKYNIYLMLIIIACVYIAK